MAANVLKLAMINKESPIFVHLKKRKRLKRHTDNNPMRKLLLSAALLAALFMSGCRPSGNRADAEPSAVADELADTSAARVRPQRTLMIGDTDHDFFAARAMGADCVLVCGGHQSRQALERCGCPVLENIAQAADYAGV